MRGSERSAMPLVKVIVPCYDYAEHLSGCVQSILSQEEVEVRVLVLDDCSPDDTPAVAADLVREDERVSYERNEQNLGLIRTVNKGLEWAEDGDYVVVLSADDLLAPGALGRATSVMESHPEVGLTYGRAMHFESDRPLPQLDARWRGTKIWRGEEWIEKRCRMGHNCIASPEAVVRTSVQRQVGSYDLPSHHASELNMWLRIAAVADVAYVQGAAQALYRIHTNSMLRTMLASDGAMTDVATRRTAFESFFAAAGTDLREAERLRDLARRALAKQALWRASRAYDRGRLDNAEGVPAEEWIAFALQTYPEAKRLNEWRGLRLRQKIGAGRTLLFPPFLATGATQRLRSNYYRRRLHTRGI